MPKPADLAPPLRRDRFARKFEGAPVRLNLRIDAFRKRKFGRTRGASST
jgi:hypothetical protein